MVLYLTIQEESGEGHVVMETIQMYLLLHLYCFHHQEDCGGENPDFKEILKLIHDEGHLQNKATD